MREKETGSFLQSSLRIMSTPGIWLTNVVALVPHLGLGGWLPGVSDSTGNFQKGRQDLSYKEALSGRVTVCPLHALFLWEGGCWAPETLERLEG